MLRRNQPVPLYYQVEVAIRRAIEHGEFPDGRLPPEGDLATRYQVSRMTLRAALGRLEEDGLIERHRARGTFVRQEAVRKIVRHPNRLLGFEEDLRRQGAAPRVELLAVEQLEPPEGIARVLELGEGEQTYRVRRRGIVNQQPLWIEARYYPPDVGARMVTQDLQRASITARLEEVLGTRVTSGRVHVEAAIANSRQAQQLEVRSGHPLLVNQFAFFDSSGRALEVLRAVFRGDRYAFSFELSSRPPSGVEWLEGIQGEGWPRLTTHLDSEPATALASHSEGSR
jgi:GntR family transcriptional regulator